MRKLHLSKPHAGDVLLALSSRDPVGEVSVVFKRAACAPQIVTRSVAG